MSRPVGTKQRQEDALYLHSLREARIVLALWAACLIFTCTYCYLYGYLSHEPHPSSTGRSVGQLAGDLTEFDRDPASLSMPLALGIPDWVFYGIVLPWVGCILATFWFCLFIFREDELSDPAAIGSDREVSHE